MTFLSADIQEWLESNTPLGSAEHALANRDERREQLADLGIPEDSQIGQFYVYHGADSVSGWYELNDLDETADWTEYAHEELEVADHFLALSSAEGDGIVLYDKRTGAVYDVTFGQFEALEAGELPSIGDTFEDFLRWCRDCAQDA